MLPLLPALPLLIRTLFIVAVDSELEEGLDEDDVLDE
jgi:hypothetical protein